MRPIACLRSSELTLHLPACKCSPRRPRLPTGASDRVLALSSISFDLSVYDVFGLLGAGATLAAGTVLALALLAHKRRSARASIEQQHHKSELAIPDI